MREEREVSVCVSSFTAVLDGEATEAGATFCTTDSVNL